MSLLYRVVRALLWLFFHVFSRFEVVGRENLPAGGPLIVAINHIHTLDSPAVMVALPWQVKIFAARKWERHPLGLFLRAAGASFITRGEVDRQALRGAVAVLRDGGVFGIAPEGTRSKTGQLQPARGGVAYVAHLSGAPILPVTVTGVEKMGPSLRRLRPARVRVTIGTLYRSPVLDHRPRSDELLEMADDLMRHLAHFLPQEYRGVYAEGSHLIEHRHVPRDLVRA